MDNNKQQYCRDYYWYFCKILIYTYIYIYYMIIRSAVVKEQRWNSCRAMFFM